MTHPLNLAVAFQILNDIRNGELRSCMAMGFAENDLKDLLEPQCMSVLVNSSVPWFKVVVDGLVVRRLLEQVKNSKEEELIMYAIKIGASSSMLQELFGMPAKEVALRRTILGVPNRVGRWPTVNQDQERKLWDHWANSIKERPLDVRDSRALFDRSIRLTEKMPMLNLSMVWTTIQSWIEQDLV
ncbi:STY4526/YPO1902 family pathogenicity island replication protein [Pseudomonas sp. NA-150]|uniref:STY4526/YPO1902 family pathogenicity island replication protein n=1 Tax=Pseudomonas sp. NA-150 TaxID=3367525 RepID=UPI0037CB897B